jgi:hypothetical protein
MELFDLGASSWVLDRWEPVLEEMRIVQAKEQGFLDLALL